MALFPLEPLQGEGPPRAPDQGAPLSRRSSLQPGLAWLGWLWLGLGLAFLRIWLDFAWISAGFRLGGWISAAGFHLLGFLLDLA